MINGKYLFSVLKELTNRAYYLIIVIVRVVWIEMTRNSADSRSDRPMDKVQ